MRLLIANKLYSSWSLRPWLLMRALDMPFEETVIPLFLEGSKEKILAHSPTGKVPCLVDGDITVWESLAIIEYLADRFPEKQVWPAQVKAKAHARAICSEMHAGFQPLRTACAMNLGKRFAVKEYAPEVMANVARVETIWREARERFADRSAGAFLYGAFGAADAMYAPIVTRLDTYQFAVAQDTRAYMDEILSHPAYVAWRTAALAEPPEWNLAHYEDGHRAVETFSS